MTEHLLHFNDSTTRVLSPMSTFIDCDYDSRITPYRMLSPTVTDSHGQSRVQCAVMPSGVSLGGQHSRGL